MRITLIIILAAISLSTQAQKNNLKLVSDVWPPYINQAGETSFASELVKEALVRTGRSMEMTITEFQDVLSSIENGDYDGSAALWMSEERKAYLKFSAPYLQNQLVLVSGKGGDVSARSLSSLGKKRIAVVGTYAYGNELTEAQELEVVPGKSDQENLERLLNEEVDYMLVDGLLIQYLTTYQQNDVSKYLEVGDRPILTRSLHFALGKDVPGADAIMESFNKEILAMIIDGTYNRILNLNWIRADVNGDGKMEMVLHGNQAGKSAPKSSYDVYFQKPGDQSYTGGYYIQGQMYQDWDNVPKEFKVAPMKDEDFSKIGALNFSFSKGKN